MLLFLWVNGTKVKQVSRFSNTRESSVRFWQVLAGFGRPPPAFLRYSFGNPSVPVRKKDVFSEQAPDKCRAKPEDRFSGTGRFTPTASGACH
ncbi:hypothetical protein FY557_13805 [Chryseobacterium sp. SN22]|uniref:hypothetical protein n=1 Tax=Chryseobacterium sp. SN22 TaxID=2606431 RepID=UPI0011ED9423|nr:hypothetical protein [Chryseobacterium sp. SN22]KAA0127241.1 hypothetical protein FY557_13805 [Chryseobacterium sp. SN22]